MDLDTNELSKTCLENDMDFQIVENIIVFSCPKDPSEDLTKKILKIIPKGIEAHFIVGPSKSTKMALELLMRGIHFQGQVMNNNRIFTIAPIKVVEDSFIQSMIKIIKEDNFFNGIRFILGEEEIYYNKAVEKEKEENKTDRKKITQRDELSIRLLNERDLDVSDFIKAISI